MFFFLLIISAFGYGQFLIVSHLPGMNAYLSACKDTLGVVIPFLRMYVCYFRSAGLQKHQCFGAGSCSPVQFPEPREMLPSRNH